jgi:hypothetical protein
VVLFKEVLEEIGDKLGPPEQIRDQEPRNPNNTAALCLKRHEAQQAG